MKTFAVLIAALALASAASDGDEIEFWPIPTIPEIETRIAPEIRPLPLPIVPELRPLPVVPEEETVITPELRPLPVVPEEETVITPELRPLPVVPEENVVVPELRPLPVEEPCAACFAYMSSLIDQLTETVAVEAHIPDGPLQINPETEIRPLPLPETPSISLFPSFVAV